jgi:hypothetical protein
MNPKWTHEQKEKISELWRLGKTYEKIAKEIDPSGKTSRCAISGIIHRLGLVYLPAPHKQHTKGPAMAFDWTPSNDRRLAQLWDQGGTFSQIAHYLDPSGKLSRSAVQGRIRRLGLPKRSEQIGKHFVQRRHNECAWIVAGEKSTARVCAELVVHGSSYCRRHHNAAHVRNPKGPQ